MDASNQPLFPNAPKPATPITPIGPSGAPKVALIIDPSIKTDPPVATIERFDAGGGTIKVFCPGGAVTIDAATIGGPSFSLNSEANVGRMLITGLADLSSEERAKQDDVKLNRPENFNLRKDPTAFTTARLIFGVNGSSETVTISSRAVLASTLSKIMAAFGGTLTPEPADATHPDALKNATAPTPAAVASAAAPAKKPEVTIKVPSIAPAASTGVKISIPGTANTKPLTIATTPAASAPAATAASPVPLKATQKIDVAPPAPMTADTLKLSDGIVFKTESSGTERALFIVGNDVFVMRRGSEPGQIWQPEYRLDHVEHMRAQFAAKWKAGEVSWVKDRLPAAEIASLKSLCERDTFPDLRTLV